MSYPFDRHTWTDAEVERLFYLRDMENRTFVEIAIDLGIDSAKKCCAKYNATRIPGAQPAPKRYKSWTGDAIDNLLKLRDVKHLDWPDIASELGYSNEQCINRYQIVKGFRTRGYRSKTHELPKADEKAVADRDTRDAAKLLRDEAAILRGDLTSIINGDPAPGYSALDRRKVNA